VRNRRRGETPEEYAACVAAEERASGATLSAEALGFLGKRRGRAGQPKPKKAPPRLDDKRWAALRGETLAMVSSGDWAEATTAHFVALYALLHERVYGAACEELDPRARFVVVGKAAAMLRDKFADDAPAMAAFLRWTWEREEWRARKPNWSGNRVGPWLQFNGAILTDYNVEMNRRRTGT
jgi:hypothetical protein